MANILDYMDWRGDLTFAERPFNEVDNLILSVLSYLDFEGIVSGSSKTVGIRTVNRLYKEKEAAGGRKPEDMTAFSESFDSHIPELLDKAASTRRFSKTRLSHYVSRTDADRDKQMAAVTFLLEDGTKYVSFRGTDDTLIGWKEDFDLSYMDATAGQKDAMKYLNLTLRNNKVPIRVGGHSKGGNFAVYAAAFCNERIREQIIAVYSNDGPGFKKSIAGSQEIRDIRSKIIKFSPEYSAIGVILTNTVRAHLVQSDMKGVNQHNAFSWQVLGEHFVEADERDPGSILFDRTMNTWIDGESDENRQLFIDTLFGMFMDSGVQTLSEVTNNKMQSTRIAWNALRSMPKESRNKFLTIFLHLEQSRLKAQAMRPAAAQRGLKVQITGPAAPIGLKEQTMRPAAVQSEQPVQGSGIGGLIGSIMNMGKSGNRANSEATENRESASEGSADTGVISRMKRRIFHIEDENTSEDD